MQSTALMVALQRSYVVTLYCEQSPTLVLRVGVGDCTDSGVSACTKLYNSTRQVSGPNPDSTHRMRQSIYLE